MRKYRSIRQEIKTGDVFFTYSPALFSKLIRLFTQSKVSHVGFFIWWGNRLFAIESLEGKGCIMSPASTRFKGKMFMIGETGHQVAKDIIANKVFDTVGRVKYDMWGAIASLFIDTKTSQKFCSEYTADVLELQFPALDRGITPVDIANRC